MEEGKLSFVCRSLSSSESICLNKGMINAIKSFSFPWATLSLALSSVFCSKASLVRIAAAVSIAMFAFMPE